MSDPDGRAERLLAEAMALLAAGREPGRYALIAQMTVEPDGTFVLSWDCYGPAPG